MACRPDRVIVSLACLPRADGPSPPTADNSLDRELTSSQGARCSALRGHTGEPDVLAVRSSALNAQVVSAAALSSSLFVERSSPKMGSSPHTTSCGPVDLVPSQSGLKTRTGGEACQMNARRGIVAVDRSTCRRTCVVPGPGRKAGFPSSSPPVRFPDAVEPEGNPLGQRDRRDRLRRRSSSRRGSRGHCGPRARCRRPRAPTPRPRPPSRSPARRRPRRPADRVRASRRWSCPTSGRAAAGCRTAR